jgi:hypothetical protein
LFIGSRPLKLEGTSVLWWDIVLWKSEGDVTNIPYGNCLEVYGGLMHLISLRHNLSPYMHLFWTKSSKPTIGILAPPRVQKWVSILQINGGITSIFSQLLNTLVIYFFTKCDCLLFFSHFLSGIYQTMNWQGQCQKLLRSYQILLSCKLTCSGIYNSKFLQRLPWWMVTLFLLFADIWAGTNSQVEFPIVSRKSLTVDSCS